MKPIFQIQGQIEIVKKDSIFLNQRRIDLLRQIRQTGSINAASKVLKMSYQQAWHFIKEMNELSPLPLIIRQRGGAQGGGAVVTKSGETAIKEFERLSKSFNDFQRLETEKLGFCFF